VRPPAGEVVADRPEQHVIVEQPVEPRQDRLELQRQGRDQREQIDRRVPVA
jgi:hypothetical protein